MTRLSSHECAKINLKIHAQDYYVCQRIVEATLKTKQIGVPLGHQQHHSVVDVINSFQAPILPLGAAY